MLAKVKFLLIPIALTIFLVIVLGLSLRGHPGNVQESELNSLYWKDDGPLELSPERGKFALTYSLVENKSFTFSIPIARFATPDVAYSEGKYVSLFTPGFSFLTAPGFLLGRLVNASQLGTYAMVSLAAILNVFLIRSISRKLGATGAAATIAGLTFLFASPAFAYAVSLYQHHFSTLFLLLGIWLVIRFGKNILTPALVFFVTIVSFTVDNPNIILMLPVLLYSLTGLLDWKSIKSEISVRLNLLGVLALLIGVIPLAFLLTSNQLSHGNALKLPGTLRSVKAIDERGVPAMSYLDAQRAKNQTKDLKITQKSAINFFKTRHMLNGFYVHVFSPDRGLIFFSPILLLGLVGIFLIKRENRSISAVIFASIGANLILYSMWGDPWGGWAFGSRYLIPSFAMLAICLSLVLCLKRVKFFVGAVFIAMLTYSVGVNLTGALSTNRIPPQNEAVELAKISRRVEKFSYDRGAELLDNNLSKSFLFTHYFKRHLTSWEYFLILGSLIMLPLAFLTLLNLLLLKKGDDQ